MSINRKNDDSKFKVAYDRAMLRSAFVSMFWAVISDRKKNGLTLVALAQAIGSSKHEVSRWFNGDPNWTINTIASIAHALKLTLRIQAVDANGNVYGPNGVVQVNKAVATSDLPQSSFTVTRKPNGVFVQEQSVTSSRAA